MKRLILTLALLFAGLALPAQTRIDVQAPNLVAVNEQFQLVFSVEGETAPSDFSWEPGEDLQLVWGPQKSTSTSVSIVNGRRSRSSRVDFIYIVIPRRAGNISIPAASATVKGSPISSRAVTIEVVDQGGASSSSSGSQQAPSGRTAPSGGIENASGDDIILRLSFNKREAYVGETITASLKLYTKVNIASLESPKLPVFNGFWSQQNVPSSIEMQRENLNGEIYQAALLRSYVLVPQKAGELVVDPSELVCVIQERVTSNRPRSIFDSFFQDDYRTVRRRVVTPSYTLRIRNLPAGAPASFAGGVGSFRISASVSADSLKANEASSLRLTVSGTGNISMLEAPKVRFPIDFETYDVRTTDNIGKDSNRISGTRTFEYPFIPRSHGVFEIDPVEYSYFDLASRQYVTLTTEPIPIRVDRGAESEIRDSGGLTSGVAGKSVRNLGSDIRFIRSGDPGLRDTGSFLVFSPLFFGLLGALLLIAAAACLVLKRRADLRSDTVFIKNKAATKMARKRLANAETFLRKDLYTAFYEELHKALLGYVGDKLNIDMADMSKDNISATLRENSVPDGLASEFTALLDECEMARYSPVSDHGSMDARYTRAVSTVSAIDSALHSRRVSARSVLPLLALLICLPAFAGPWEDGVAAYNDGRYDDAIQAWTSIEAGGRESRDLYYNLGNAYFKTDSYAKAILYYERASRLDPSDADVRHNLEFARTFTQDRIEEVPEMVVEQVGRRIRNVLPSDVWAVLFFVFLTAALACALLYLLSRSRSRRKLGFYLGTACLLAALLALDFASWHRSDYRHDNSAIVMPPVVSVRSSPSSTSSKDLFVLHEGTRVKILDTLGDWSNIELSDGRQGWINSSEIEII